MARKLTSEVTQHLRHVKDVMTYSGKHKPRPGMPRGPQGSAPPINGGGKRGGKR
jgi:hypothetical protein